MSSAIKTATSHHLSFCAGNLGDSLTAPVGKIPLVHRALASGETGMTTLQVKAKTDEQGNQSRYLEVTQYEVDLSQMSIQTCRKTYNSLQFDSSLVSRRLGSSKGKRSRRKGKDEDQRQGKQGKRTKHTTIQWSAPTATIVDPHPSMPKASMSSTTSSVVSNSRHRARASTNNGENHGKRGGDPVGLASSLA
jgi:hypothetical protein